MKLCKGTSSQLTRQSVSRRQSVKVCAKAFDVLLRPYTLRRGDTLSSIASKRGITVDQLITLNPEINPDALKENNTILLPSGKLSVRDREILDGIGQGYRLYPVRIGETIEEILSKRNITDQEFLSLNPGLNMADIKENQAIKLPSNKFTVREREMLIGSGILPSEFFIAAKNPFVVGFSILMLVCGVVLAWQRFYKDEDEDFEKE